MSDAGPNTAVDDTRLWLRLLTCANAVETALRRRLREEFGTTLPRFDLLAQLARVPEGLPLGEVSRRMMVSNGNVTGLVERLLAEGLIAREVDPDDRRSTRVRLTPDGVARFDRMAAAHRRWLADLFAGLDAETAERLHADLGRLRASAEAAPERRREAA